MNKPTFIQRCGLGLSAVVIAVMLLATLLLAGSAQSAGGRTAGDAGPSVNPFAESVDSPLAGRPQAQVEAVLRSSPVMFIENVGQFDPSLRQSSGQATAPGRRSGQGSGQASRARFQVRGAIGTMWLAEDGLWITLLEQERDWRLEIGDSDQTLISNLQSPVSTTRGVNLRLSFPGANRRLRVEPFDRLDTVVSYFTGNDPEQWYPDVPVWGGVRYVDLYPGVNLEVTGDGGRWAWRLVCRANCQFALQDVRLRVEGAEALAVDGNALRLTTAVGDFTLPLLQAVAHDGTPLDLTTARPGVNGNEVSTPFASLTPIYNLQSEDPQSAIGNPQSSDLLYSTFLGGSGYDNGLAIAVDADGSAYVTGYTASSDFPTTPGAFDIIYNGGNTDAFVVKVNADGTGLAYATFLGGSGSDEGLAIAVDGAGSAYVTGDTWSSNFPTTTGAFDTSYNGDADAFAVKVNADGAGLAYATFLGGSDDDWGNAIVVDADGSAYVTGRAESSDFPTTAGAFDTSHNGGINDAFAVKVNADGTRLAYATFLGGSGYDNGLAIAVDVDGSAYVTGETFSSDFPITAGSFDTTYNGGVYDAFVVKVNAGGTDLAYAAFLGGSERDYGRAIVVDGTGRAYVTGLTESSDFPTTAGAFDTSYNGGINDAFVVKVNADGAGLAYATFLGGGGDDWGNGIDVHADGRAYVTGYTESSDFPTTAGAFDTSYNGGVNDAFVVKLDADGAGLAYATFLGGSDRDHGMAIAVDGAGSAYVTGDTWSSDFPVTAGAFDTSYNGGGRDAFVARLAVGAEPDIQVTPAAIEASLAEGQSTTVPLTIANVGSDALSFSIAESVNSEQLSVISNQLSVISDQLSIISDQLSPITDHWSLNTDHSRIDPALWRALDEAPEGRATFFVYLEEQADLSPAYTIRDWKARGEFVYRTLRETAQRSQAKLLADLEARKLTGDVTRVRPFFIVNAVAVTGGRSVVDALAARSDVAYLAPEPVFHIPEPLEEKDAPTTPAGVEWNVAQIGADRVWDEFGITGEGVVVANIDTGVDHTHPALVNQYRGTATGSHDYNWYDPTGRYPDAPGDNNGHGTHVMGTMVGDDPSTGSGQAGAGNQIGVAPGATWIAAKGCAGRGCRGGDLLAAAGWILAPCPIGVVPGDPACDAAKRPQVINNSWGGPGGDPWLEAMVSAWRAAGIFPAFAAGNDGPHDSTVGSPGDYAVSFASGATDQADVICRFSSRGPSRLTPETKPDVTAPGCKGIRSALPGGGYGTKNGTSMASPHTAGVVAMLLQANPNLSLEEIEGLLTSTALDLGPEGSDKAYGYGRLDAYAAVAVANDPVPWLSFDPTRGRVEPNSQMVISVTLNAAGLSTGTHRARLLITSNDPDESTVTVPVTLTVTTGTPEIAHVRASNLWATSASVSWITTRDADGRVYYGTDPASLDNVAYDDRGAGVEDDVHHVTIGGLTPNTTYYFYVASDGATDDNEGQYYQFTTGPLLSARDSDIVYGQVFKSNGVTPAAGVLVYLQVLDIDGSDSQGQSGVLSGLTDSNGYWIDAKTGGAIDLAAARAENGQNYFVYSESGDAVRIEIQGAADCDGLMQVDTGDDSPAPDITLSCLNMIDVDITPGWGTFVWPAVPADGYSASDLLGAIQDADGDAPEISQWLPEMGNWSGHVRGMPFGDFDVASGEPYFLRANQRSLLRLEGGIGIVQSEAVTLTTGWNFAALPRTTGVLSASVACEQIAAQGGAVDEINRWDADAGNWAGHICGLPFGDFEMTPDEGYFIKSQADSVWRPSGGTGGQGKEGKGRR